MILATFSEGVFLGQLCVVTVVTRLAYDLRGRKCIEAILYRVEEFASLRGVPRCLVIRDHCKEGDARFYPPLPRHGKVFRRAVVVGLLRQYARGMSLFDAVLLGAERRHAFALRRFRLRIFCHLSLFYHECLPWGQFVPSIFRPVAGQDSVKC